MERIRLRDEFKRVSWGSIFGGVVTVLAISILLSILASAIGLFMFDPTSENPTSGMGTNFGIWTAISLIISLAAGGFVAGKLSGADGMIHGFLAWATTMIVSVILIGMMAVGAVKLTANVLGSVSSAAGSIISGVGSAVGSGVSGIADQVGNLFEDMDLTDDVNRGEVRSDIRQALRRSGVRELQPEYLQNQMKAVRSDLRRSARRLVANPTDADKIIDDFTNRLQTRAERITQNVDREDITRAIANNTNMSQAEVDRAVDEYSEIINNAVDRGREQIENLQESIDNAKQELANMKQQALEKADEAANAGGRSALIAFFAMLIGAVISVFAGMYGAKKTMEGYEA